MPFTTWYADDLALTVFRVLQKRVLRNAAGSPELLNLRPRRQARGCPLDDTGTVRRALLPRCGKTEKAIKELQCAQTGYQQRTSVLGCSCTPRRTGKMCCLQCIGDSRQCNTSKVTALYAVAHRVRCRYVTVLRAARVALKATPCLKRTGLSAAGKLSVLDIAAVSAKG